MQITVNLKAGQRARQQTAGRYLVLLSTGDADSVSLGIYAGNEELDFIRTAKKGTKARLANTVFTHIDLISPVDTTVEVVISPGLVDFDFTDGAMVHIGPEDRGETLAKPLFVSGLTLDSTPATAIGDGAGPVAVTDAPAQFIAASPNRKAFRVTNLGPDEVAIGGPGLSWAKRAIVIAEGFGWLETEGAPMAWRAVCAPGKSASLNVQELTL